MSKPDYWKEHKVLYNPENDKRGFWLNNCGHACANYRRHFFPATNSICCQCRYKNRNIDMLNHRFGCPACQVRESIERDR